MFGIKINRNIPNTLSNQNYYNTPNSISKIPIPKGESLIVEPKAMKAYALLKMETGIQSPSFLNSLATSLASGGKVIQNKFTATEKGAWIALESDVKNQIIEHTLSPGEKITFRRGALIARDPNISVNVSKLNLSGALSSLGLLSTIAETTDNKQGRIFLKSAHGPIEKIDLTKDESVVVDNDQIIGFSGDIKIEVFIPGSNQAFSMIASGEGIAIRFSGEGTIYVGSSKKAP